MLRTGFNFLKGFIVSKSTYLGFFVATGCVWGANLSIELFGFPRPGDFFYLIFFLFMFGVSKAISRKSDKHGALDNWETWQKVLSSRPMLFLVALSSVISLSFALVPSGIKNETFPLQVHLYWLSGFCVLLSSLFFQLFAPKVFKYRNYGVFDAEIGSFFDIWDNIQEAKTVLSNELREGRSKFGTFYEHKILSRASQKESCPHVFLLTKKHLRYENPWLRGFVGLFLIPPAYIMPSVLAWNSAGIFSESIKEIGKHIAT